MFLILKPESIVESDTVFKCQHRSPHQSVSEIFPVDKYPTRGLQGFGNGQVIWLKFMLFFIKKRKKKVIRNTREPVKFAQEKYLK